jgi:hypothetical protein
VTFSRAVGVELRNNLVHELGAFEKQSSMLFLAKACGVYAHHNVFFNGTLLIVLSSFCFATCFERLSCVEKTVFLCGKNSFVCQDRLGTSGRRKVAHERSVVFTQVRELESTLTTGFAEATVSSTTSSSTL